LYDWDGANQKFVISRDDFSRCRLAFDGGIQYTIGTNNRPKKAIAYI